MLRAGKALLHQLPPAEPAELSSLADLPSLLEHEESLPYATDEQVAQLGIVKGQASVGEELTRDGVGGRRPVSSRKYGEDRRLDRAAERLMLRRYAAQPWSLRAEVWREDADGCVEAVEVCDELAKLHLPQLNLTCDVRAPIQETGHDFLAHRQAAWIRAVPAPSWVDALTASRPSIRPT